MASTQQIVCGKEGARAARPVDRGLGGGARGSWVRRMGAGLRDAWAAAADYQKLLYALGAVFLASGAFHAVVFLVDGGPWDGPVSWRKPIVFGFSFGATSWSLAWISGWLPHYRWRQWLLAGAFALGAFGDVSLITLQRWRGVPSHFNNGTGFDAAVLMSMAVSVGLVATAIVVLMLWSFVSLRAPASVALAIRAGLALLVAGQVLGGAIIANGNRVLEAGGTDPATFGAAGALKVPHAVALHAVQVLPVLAWLLSYAAWDERRRHRVVLAGVAGYVGLVGVSGLQAFGGLAPLDRGATTGCLFAFSALLLAGAYAGAELAVARRGNGPAGAAGRRVGRVPGRIAGGPWHGSTR